jgi:hypothetical protein
MKNFRKILVIHHSLICNENIIENIIRTGGVCFLRLFLQAFHFLLFELSSFINAHGGREACHRPVHVHLVYVEKQ